MNNFIKERNEALLSLDKKKIIAYMKKYGISIPQNEKIFWAGVHKAICSLYFVNKNKITLEQYTKSANWLKDNGFGIGIGVN